MSVLSVHAGTYISTGATRARACLARVRVSVSARVRVGTGRTTLGVWRYCALGAAALRRHCSTHSALPLHIAIATPCVSVRMESARVLMHVCDSAASEMVLMMLRADLPRPPYMSTEKGRKGTSERMCAGRKVLMLAAPRWCFVFDFSAWCTRWRGSLIADACTYELAVHAVTV